MDRIVRAAEADELTEHRPPAERHQRGYAAAVTHAARVLAGDVRAVAIAGVTRTGRTAELLSVGRAQTPVYAFTPDEQVSRRLALWWGVTPVHQPLASGLEANVAAMEAHLRHRGAAEPGDVVVMVGSHPFEA